MKKIQRFKNNKNLIVEHEIMIRYNLKITILCSQNKNVK